MRRLSVLLALAFTLTLVSAIPVQAKKPLRGTADVEFNLLWPGPQLDFPDWVGTINFNGEEYGIVFFWLSTGKTFEVNRGNASFFYEEWRIYDWVTFNFETEEWTHGALILLGYDAGVVSLGNSKYRMNGNVEFANVTFANGAFAAWQDRNVHISGEILWYEFGAPHYAPGTFRIN